MSFFYSLYFCLVASLCVLYAAGTLQVLHCGIINVILLLMMQTPVTRAYLALCLQSPAEKIGL